MNKLSVALIALVLAALAGVAWFALRPAPDLPPPETTASVPPPPPAPAPSAPPAPLVQHPIEPASAPASAAAAPEPLPPLADADAFVNQRLADLVGRTGMLTLLQTDGFVQRVVATVDNLTRNHAPPRVWPVNPMAGRFTTVKDADGRERIAPANAARYTAFVDVVTAVPPAQAAAQYRRLYPLFQSAWKELGMGGSYFNDRLVEVVDHLLAAPPTPPDAEVTLTGVKGPIPSERPWVRYEYADPALEAQSAGRKMLLRLAPAQRARLEQWLRDFRAQVAR